MGAKGLISISRASHYIQGNCNPAQNAGWAEEQEQGGRDATRRALSSPEGDDQAFHPEEKGGQRKQKNEEIDRVVSLVQSIDSQESKNAGLQKKIALIEQKLLKSLDSQESRNVFEIQFSSLYPEFTKNLLKVYPQLTKTELRLCCLLRAEFSTKTISSLMHLENETIDQYRHRLRKKLQLPPRTDLGVFMQTIQ